MREARGSNPRISNAFCTISRLARKAEHRFSSLCIWNFHLFISKMITNIYANSHVGLYHCKTVTQNKEEQFFSHSCCRLIIATFRLQYEDHYEFKFSELSTRCRFGGRKISKCACSELKTRTRSRPRTPIWRSLVTIKVQHKLKKLYSREKNSVKRGGIPFALWLANKGRGEGGCR